MIPKTIKSTGTKSNQQMPMRSIVAVVFLLAIACPGVLVQSFQPSSLPRSKPSFVNIDARRQYSSAAGMDFPSDASTTAAAKNERMRQLVQNSNNHGSTLQQQQKDKKASSTKASAATKSGGLQAPPEAAPHVMEVSTLAEFKQVVVDDAHASNDQVTAVRFYAPWCRSCRAVEGRFYRLGRSDSVQVSASASRDAHTATGSKFGNVKFVQVAVSPENAALHQGLGVTALPYAHIYHQAIGLVEELRMNQKRFGDFEQILQSYNSGYCALPDSVDPDTGVYEAPYFRS